jgi:hypothetical protein
VARADLHLIEWIVSSGLVRLGLQYNRADELRSVFEGGVLAHQPIDGGLAVGIQSFLRVSSFRMLQLFLPRGHAPNSIVSPSVSKLGSSDIPVPAPVSSRLYVGRCSVGR